MWVLKHVVEECVGSMQLGVSRHFIVLEHSGLKIVDEKLVLFKNIYEFSYIIF